MKVGDILDHLEEVFPGYTRKEHRKFLTEVYSGKKPPKDDDQNTTACPQCGKQAEGEDQIDDLFGWRYEDTPQSWCKECRNS